MNLTCGSRLIKYAMLMYCFISADPKKTLHLRALDGANERLHLFEANLLEEGSFDAAVNGCDCVFHTASPFYHNVKDPKVSTIAVRCKIIIAVCYCNRLIWT